MKPSPGKHAFPMIDETTEGIGGEWEFPEQAFITQNPQNLECAGVANVQVSGFQKFPVSLKDAL